MTRALWLLLLPSLAWAQAVRYNDAPAARPRPPLATRIDELVARVAKQERRPEPRPDARLDAAATELVRLLPDRGPPANELVEGALSVQGIVEPPPSLLLATLQPGDEEGLLREIATSLPATLASGRFTRVGVGLAPAEHGELHVMLMLLESFVDLDPIARAQPLGANVLLRGKLHDGVERPEAFITTPDGAILRRVLVGGDPVRFGGTFRCGPAKGRYQVELAGESRLGPVVVANFPVWCGMTAPTSARAAAPAHRGKDEPFTTTAAAEQTVWRQLNEDRAHAHLPALAWDDRLAAVARAHSADMAAHHFVGHVSPTTGDAFARGRKAGIEGVVGENVARAFSAGEAERGLMNSPGHRANILNRDARRVGVGVALDDDKELLVTQLFSRPPEVFDAHTVDELRRDVAALRRARKLPALAGDAALDQLAQSTAVEQAAHRLSTSDAKKRIDAALNSDGQRWREGRALFAFGGAVSDLVGASPAALGDDGATHVGFGVAPGRDKGASGLYIVVILATRR